MKELLLQGIAIVLFVMLLIFLCKKYNFLLNYSGDVHQKFTLSTRVPLVGGIVILIFFNVILLDYESQLENLILSTFFIGFLSDLKIIRSPNIKLLIQSLLVFVCVYLSEIYLTNTRIVILDYFLNNILFSYIFTAFCILIIINGTNFIDGNNVNVLSYYLIICWVLYNLNLNGFLSVETELLIKISCLLLILGVFNFFNKIYLGDSGSFILGASFSFLLIDLYLKNQSLSPFFIILLLWYPAFENLFSIVRKVYLTNSPSHPDSDHLHQLIYYFLLKKISFKKFRKNIINSLTGLMINIYNLAIVVMAIRYPSNSIAVSTLLLVNLSVYCYLYFLLYRFKIKQI